MLEVDEDIIHPQTRCETSHTGQRTLNATIREQSRQCMFPSRSSAESSSSSPGTRCHNETNFRVYILTGLDYCNAMLAAKIYNCRTPAGTKCRCPVTGIGSRDRVIQALQQLHWLPVQYRTTFKLCLFMHKIHTELTSSYLTDKVTTTADCNLLLVCAPPVPAHIRRQGNVSNLANEVSPTQNLLRGTVFCITFKK